MLVCSRLGHGSVFAYAVFVSVLLILGLIGFLFLLLSTIGVGLIAGPFARPFGPSRVSKITETLEILLPVYNEEETIVSTLDSIRVSAEKARGTASIKAFPTILMGLDHVTDHTRMVARRWAKKWSYPIKFAVNTGSAGKWNMLCHMIERNNTDWVGIVDSGAHWSASLLEDVKKYMRDPRVLGIAPSYAPSKASGFIWWHWRLERFIKRGESRLGGPISVHGSTVFYRRPELWDAVKSLCGKPYGNQTWINDDVAIPLMLRIQAPSAQILYLDQPTGDPYVTDFGVAQGEEQREIETARRRRILIGNVQWMQSLYFSAWKASPNVGCIASRRFFRFFWPYWVVMIMIGFVAQVYMLSNLVAQALILTSALAIGSFIFWRYYDLSASFIAALRGPIYFWYSKASIDRCVREEWD